MCIYVQTEETALLYMIYSEPILIKQSNFFLKESFIFIFD